MTQVRLQSPRWSEFAWRLYTRLPWAVIDVPGRCLPYLLPFYKLRVPVTRLRGPTYPDGQPGTVITAGAEPGVNYWVQRFFVGQPQRELVGKRPLWLLPRILKRPRVSADLTIARVDRLSSRLLFDATYLFVPEWVGSRLAEPDPAKLLSASHSVRDDLRIVRRNGLTSEVSHTEADFDLFYYTMHVPFIRQRHGEQGIIRNIHKLRRCFRRGGLLWIRRGGQRISGVIFQQQDHVLRFVALGTVNGEWTPVKAGAIAALYYYALEYAHKLGCRSIDFGGCRPSLGDGPLRYKRKWGMSLVEKHDAYYDFLVHWNRLSEPVAAFLAHTPLIFRDRDGLSAIQVINQSEPVTQVDVRKTYHATWMAGLHRLYLVAASGWQATQESPPRTVLVNLAGLEDCDPHALQTLWNQELKPL